MCAGFPKYNPLAASRARRAREEATEPDSRELTLAVVEAAVREFQEIVTAMEAEDPDRQPFDLDGINEMVASAESGEITWVQALFTIKHNLQRFFASQREPQLVGAAIYNPRTGELVEIPVDQLGGMLFGDEQVDHENGFLNVPSF